MICNKSHSGEARGLCVPSYSIAWSVFLLPILARMVSSYLKGVSVGPICEDTIIKVGTSAINYGWWFSDCCVVSSRVRKFELCSNPMEIKVGKFKLVRGIQVVPPIATVEAPAK